jgi:hypothetical protein
LNEAGLAQVREQSVETLLVEMARRHVRSRAGAKESGDEHSENFEHTL